MSGLVVNSNTSTTTFRTRLPSPTEREFQDAVADVARLAGWRVVHFRPARTAEGWRTPGSYDAHGWPDLTLRLLPGAEVYLWYPEDWHELVAVLTGVEHAA
jgi:hypothetical protein